MKKLVFAAAAALALSACAGSDLMVLEKNSSNYSSNVVNLVYEEATVPVDPGKQALLAKYMDDAFTDVGFTLGEGLTMRYGFIGYDEGSQAARYFLGGIGGGEAKMVLRAEFYDRDGNKLASVQSEGRLAGGLLGGDSDTAMMKAAEELADYAKANF